MSNSTVIIVSEPASRHQTWDAESIVIVIFINLMLVIIAVSYVTKCRCCDASTREVAPAPPPPPPPRPQPEPPVHSVIVEEPTPPRIAWVIVETPRGGHMMLGKSTTEQDVKPFLADAV